MGEKRRYGRFYIDRFIIDEHPEFVALMLAQIEFLPLRVECQFDRDQIMYSGASPLFEEIDLGMITPEYEITFNISYDDEGETDDITWAMQKK